jgi:hypothetical protein
MAVNNASQFKERTILRDFMASLTNGRAEPLAWPELADALRTRFNLEVRTDEAFPNLALVRYNKQSSRMNEPVARECRSVVFDTRTCRLVAFSPPKSTTVTSLPQSTTVTSLPLQQQQGQQQLELYVEGVMINLFFHDGKWVLATRSKLGAHTRYYSQTKDFAAMFAEATGDVETFCSGLDPRCTYSFVLQHPENRIVVPVEKPQAVLMAKYEVLESGSVVWYPCQNAENMLKALNTWKRKAWRVPGIVYHTADGSRFKMWNSTYVAVRLLRGETPRRDFRYMQLRAAREVRQYLSYYPEEAQLMDGFETRFRDATQKLYETYCKVHKARTLKLADVPRYYHKALVELHNQFLQLLRPKDEKLHFANVREWMNKQDPARQVYLMNAPLFRSNAEAPAPAPVEPLYDGFEFRQEEVEEAKEAEAEAVVA